MLLNITLPAHSAAWAITVYRQAMQAPDTCGLQSHGPRYSISVACNSCLSWDVSREGSATSGHHCGASDAEATGLLIGPDLSSGQVASHHQHNTPQPAGAFTIPQNSLKIMARSALVESCTALIMQGLGKCNPLPVLGHDTVMCRLLSV